MLCLAWFIFLSFEEDWCHLHIFMRVPLLVWVIVFMLQCQWSNPDTKDMGVIIIVSFQAHLKISVVHLVTPNLFICNKISQKHYSKTKLSFQFHQNMDKDVGLTLRSSNNNCWCIFYSKFISILQLIKALLCMYVLVNWAIIGSSIGTYLVVNIERVDDSSLPIATYMCQWIG